jgi:hypothetical protein
MPPLKSQLQRREIGNCRSDIRNDPPLMRGRAVLGGPKFPSLREVKTPRAIGMVAGPAPAVLLHC